MTTTTAIAASFVLLGTPLPDELDILRGADTTPQIQLVLDTSCSMQQDAAPSACTYYPTAQANLIGSYQSGGTWYLSRLDQLKAALVGCRTAGDGIFDRWSSRVLFSIREFGGSRTGLLEGFDPSFGNQADLEAATFGLPASGSTPLAPAYGAAAEYFAAFFDDTNTEQCRQNYLVVMSDGVGNSNTDVTLGFIGGQADLTYRDANTCFGTTGSGCPSPPYPDAAAAYLFDDSTGQAVDALPSVTGTQPIRTFTIGFQAPTAADALLRAMAARGDGQAYSATSYDQLSAAFTEIINTIVARSRVAFSGGSIEGDGLFSGNFLYLSVFRPFEDGHWAGTTKKYCVIPPSPTSTDCLFVEDVNGELLVNPSPVDQWSGSDAAEANAGGSGQVMLEQLFGVSTVTASVPASPLDRRTLLTWRPGQPGYVEVDPSLLAPDDTWTSGVCAHHALVNTLHGFSEEVADCGAADYAPTSFDSWPQGDTVHAGTLLLQYTQNCDGPSDRCYVVTAANDGMIHFFDARTGVETSAVVPGELWKPNSIARHTLADRSDQPSVDTTRRYYVDGQLRLFHDDLDEDLVIDPGEPAYLVAGLGRGGRAYYLFDVDTFDGVPNATDNPPRVLMADEVSGLRHLMDTWAAPWMGKIELAGTERSVAIFPSGHAPELDDPLVPWGTPVRPPRAGTDTVGTPYTASCAEVGLPAELCATPDLSAYCGALGLTCSPGDPCAPCDDPDPKVCEANGLAAPYCYDWPGWVALPSNTSVWTQYPVDVTAGPLQFSAGVRDGRAYRVRFSNFDLQAGDYVAFLDTDENEVGRLYGTGTGTTSGVTSPWIYDRGFSLRIVSDGVNDTAAQGYTIEGIDVVRGPDVAASGDPHRPGIYVVDLERWNQGAAVSPPFTSGTSGTFPPQPTGSNAAPADALLYRFTADCSGDQPGAQETCIDANTSAQTADLEFMTCPISAEVSTFTEGGELTALYVGDECGQIWKLRLELDDTWSARRLVALNQTDGAGFVVPGGASKDYRKIFTQLDLVISTCPGRRAVGVYFGTGNIQRPAASDALEDPAVSGFPGTLASPERDVVGVVWDTEVLPQGAVLDDLTNVTDVEKIVDPADPGNANGWYIELDEDERMLRNPLVFRGLAYFDLYRPRSAPTECVSAIGESRTLVADNCTAEGFGDFANPSTPNEARTAATRLDSNIGGGFAFVAPNTDQPFVTLGLDATSKAKLPDRGGGRRAVQLYLWRF